MAKERKPSDVTRLLHSVRTGDRDALDEVFVLIYGELKEIAGRQRRRWRGDYTLDTTSLVHEAYVRLVGQERLQVESRAHFLGLAARAMRHILCDYARDRSAQKRAVASSGSPPRHSTPPRAA